MVRGRRLSRREALQHQSGCDRCAFCRQCRHIKWFLIIFLFPALTAVSSLGGGGGGSSSGGHIDAALPSWYLLCHSVPLVCLCDCFILLFSSDVFPCFYSLSQLIYLFHLFLLIPLCPFIFVFPHFHFYLFSCFDLQLFLFLLS